MNRDTEETVEQVYHAPMWPILTALLGQEVDLYTYKGEPVMGRVIVVTDDTVCIHEEAGKTESGEDVPSARTFLHIDDVARVVVLGPFDDEKPREPLS